MKRRRRRCAAPPTDVVTSQIAILLVDDESNVQAACLVPLTCRLVAGTASHIHGAGKVGPHHSLCRAGEETTGEGGQARETHSPPYHHRRRQYRDETDGE